MLAQSAVTHCALATCTLKFLFRWLGQKSKQAHWEDQRGGQVLKRERKIRRAVFSFTLIFFTAVLDSQWKRVEDDCVKGLSNVEMCRNKAAAGAACQLLGVGPVGWITIYEVCKWFSVWTAHLASTGFISNFGGTRKGALEFVCFVLLEEWSAEKMILNRTSFCFASQMFYTWSDQNLISDLSLGKHCLGQTSLCVFCSGSSLPRWPWTMSRRTVGVFFISVNDSSRKFQESHKSPIYRRSGSLPAKQDHSMAVACDLY